MDFLINTGDFAAITWNGLHYTKTIHGHVVEVTGKYIKFVELEGQKMFTIKKENIKSYVVKDLQISD